MHQNPILRTRTVPVHLDSVVSETLSQEQFFVVVRESTHFPVATYQRARENFADVSIMCDSRT